MPFLKMAFIMNIDFFPQAVVLPKLSAPQNNMNCYFFLINHMTQVRCTAQALGQSLLAQKVNCRQILLNPLSECNSYSSTQNPVNVQV